MRRPLPAILTAMMLSAMLACAGCDRSDRYLAIEQRNLPARPDYARPVIVSDPQPTDTWRTAAGRYKAGLGKANRIIVCFGTWYDRRRTEYAAIGAAPAKAPADPCERAQ